LGETSTLTFPLEDNIRRFDFGCDKREFLSKIKEEKF